MRHLLLLACSLFLLACTTGDTLRLGWDASFHFAPPGPTFFANQLVIITLPDGSEQTLLCSVESGSESLVVVASTPLGQTLFTASLRNGIATVEAHLPLPSKADPRALLAAVQLAEWPLEELQKGLRGNLELKEEGPLRTLLKGGRPFLLIRRERVPKQALSFELPDSRTKVLILPLEETP